MNIERAKDENGSLLPLDVDGCIEDGLVVYVSHFWSFSIQLMTIDTLVVPCRSSVRLNLGSRKRSSFWSKSKRNLFTTDIYYRMPLYSSVGIFVFTLDYLFFLFLSMESLLSNMSCHLVTDVRYARNEIWYTRFSQCQSGSDWAECRQSIGELLENYGTNLML